MCCICDEANSSLSISIPHIVSGQVESYIQLVQSRKTHNRMITPKQGGGKIANIENLTNDQRFDSSFDSQSSPSYNPLP